MTACILAAGLRASASMTFVRNPRGPTSRYMVDQMARSDMPKIDISAGTEAFFACLIVQSRQPLIYCLAPWDRDRDPDALATELKPLVNQGMCVGFKPDHLAVCRLACMAFNPIFRCGRVVCRSRTKCTLSQLILSTPSSPPTEPCRRLPSLRRIMDGRLSYSMQMHSARQMQRQPWKAMQSMMAATTG